MSTSIRFVQYGLEEQNIAVEVRKDVSRDSDIAFESPLMTRAAQSAWTQCLLTPRTGTRRVTHPGQNVTLLNPW